jgi:hypothetical protein
LWFHLDAPRNRTAITKFPAEAVRAFSERDTPGTFDFLDRVDVLSLEPVKGQRNLFRCQIAQRPPLLRLAFNLSDVQMQFRDGDEGRDGTLVDYVREFNLNFIGHDGRGVVTAFFAGNLGRQIR